MVNKIIGIQKASTLLIFFIVKFLLFPTITMGQLRYTGISDENKTGSKWISPDGLVASYDFETYTSAGLLKDFGPFENHGKTLRNIDTLGLFGKARIFSTLADIVVLPDHKSFNLDGPITVAVWVKISIPNLHQHILACSNKFVFWTTEKNQFRFADTLGNGFTTLEGTVKIDGWHSIIAVWSGTKEDALSKNNIKIFIDGVQMDGTFENKWKPGAMLDNTACVIGSTLHGAKGHQKLTFEEAIDEIQLFSRALNADEIKIHATR